MSGIPAHFNSLLASLEWRQQVRWPGTVIAPNIHTLPYRSSRTLHIWYHWILISLRLIFLILGIENLRVLRILSPNTQLKSSGCQYSKPNFLMSYVSFFHLPTSCIHIDSDKESSGDRSWGCRGTGEIHPLFGGEKWRECSWQHGFFLYIPYRVKPKRSLCCFLNAGS